MAFKTRIVPKAMGQIGSWGLSRSLLLDVLNRLLTDLAGDPDGLLGPELKPMMTRLYVFTLNDASQRLRFTFAVLRNDQAGELSVIGGHVAPVVGGP